MLSSPATTEKPSGGLASLGLSSLEDVLLKSVISSTIGPQPTVQSGKEPLSLQATSVNFRRFVQKSGPVFVAQDAAEAVFRWEDPPKTVFFALCWAFICWYPPLVLFIPNLVLVAVLLTTYNARQGHNPPPDSPRGPTTLSAAPPTEGSVDYLKNLQNIQIMMGRIASASDFGRSLVPYLTWHDARVSLALLHISVVSSFVLALLAPYIPWRLVFLILGEGLFVLCHPVVVTFLTSILSSPRAKMIQKQKQQELKRLLEDDGLNDEEVEMELIEIVRIEMETRTTDGQTWEGEVVIGGELPKGAEWLGDWMDCSPEDGAVAEDGWTYLHLDGSRSAEPVVMGEKGPIQSQTRRKKMIRRALQSNQM
ncbi:Pex29p [Sporobolomyces salmoneus]|uniref:Pex29p n=1 Tax=Sporobolomyces salmoneus TaxID=183962 RepID=UPI00317FA04E